MENTEAWAFILANADMIERFCGRTTSSSQWLRDEDFHSEVIAEIATKFDSWDKSRSPTGSAWVWWQVRKVRLRIARKMSKTPTPFGEGGISGNDGSYIDAPSSRVDSLVSTGPIDAFKLVQLKEALSAATDGQLDAAYVVAAGLSGKEVMARFGVTRQSAINRMVRLRAKVNE